MLKKNKDTKKSIQFFIISLSISCSSNEPIKAYNESINTNNQNTNNQNTNNQNTNNQNTNNQNTNNQNTNNQNTNNQNTNNQNTNNQNTNNQNTNNQNNISSLTTTELDADCNVCSGYTTNSESYYQEVKYFCAEFFDERINILNIINAFLYQFEYFPDPLVCPSGFTCMGDGYYPSIVEPNTYQSTTFQIKNGYIKIHCGQEIMTRSSINQELSTTIFKSQKAKIYIHQ